MGLPLRTHLHPKAPLGHLREREEEIQQGVIAVACIISLRKQNRKTIIMSFEYESLFNC